VERRPGAPQVVTVIHRLNGIKVLRLLLRSGAVGALDTVDESFSMTSEVHTNILAGLALDDGESIAVWLPEAEVEADTGRSSFGPTTAPDFPRTPSATRVITPEALEVTADLTETPELTIIGRDGKNHPAEYIGLDGVTGLSVLRISQQSTPGAGRRDATIAIKQRVRLFAPEPVSRSRATTSSSVSVRIGETIGIVAGLKRGLAGQINRVRMVSEEKLSMANVGGIAINDAGQTIGIVAGIEGNEAIILPPAVIRGAAQRVLARKGSVPRPWLGVSGESLAITPLERIVQRGWEPERAALLKSQSGIFLTSITPGSPAAMAALRAGDVIVRVNNSAVKSADDFSLLLEGAGKNPLLFTIMRSNHSKPESVSVKLGEGFDSWTSFSSQSGFGPRELVASPLIKQGIETMPLQPAAAARLNAGGGLFVIYVQPQTPAAKAGLRSTDIIEAVDGQAIVGAGPQQFQTPTDASYTLSIIRAKQRLVLTVTNSSP
jgi:S1-C subfamily serine protease